MVVRVKLPDGRIVEVKPPDDANPHFFRDFVNELLQVYHEDDEFTAKDCAEREIGGVRDEETATKYLKYIAEKYPILLHVKGPFRKFGNIYKIGCSISKGFEMQLEALESQFAYFPGDILCFILKFLRLPIKLVPKLRCIQCGREFLRPPPLPPPFNPFATSFTCSECGGKLIPL